MPLFLMVALFAKAANPTFITFSNSYFTVSQSGNSIEPSGYFSKDFNANNIFATLISGADVDARYFYGSGYNIDEIWQSRAISTNPPVPGSLLVSLNGLTNTWTTQVIVTNDNGTEKLIATSGGIVLSVTNSSHSFMTNGGFQTMPTMGFLTCVAYLTNNQVSWLSNQTSKLWLPLGGNAGVSTNYVVRSMFVNAGDIVVFTNITGAGILTNSFLQTIR